MVKDKLIELGKIMWKLLIVFMVLFVLMITASCSQTIPLGMRWDKNPEPDMSHYDMFVLVLSDSSLFYTLTQWPADTSVKDVQIDSSFHFDYLLATMAHIHNSPIDSLVYEWNQPMEQKYIRAYIIAADSVGNTSPIATSDNVVFIGDRESPQIPRQYLIFNR